MNEHMSLRCIFDYYPKNTKDRMCNYKNLSPKEYGMILQRSRKRKRK